MIPPGSTGITQLTTNGTSGVATYDPATGILNVPNYAANPPGSTGIRNFSTSGSSGASLYLFASGSMNIPVYASGVLNEQTTPPSGSLGLNSSTPLAIGQGLAFTFTANSNPCVLISFNILISVASSSVVPSIAVYRSNDPVPPAAGDAVTGDTLIFSVRRVAQINMQWNLTGSYLDTTVTVGTPYCYYLAVYYTTANSGVVTVLNNALSNFSILEVK